jgi:hypothetical protein
MKHYYLPLKQSATSNKPIISIQDLATIFSNIETILNFHRKLKEGFDKARANWPLSIDSIGSIFLNLVCYNVMLINLNKVKAPGLKAYGEYVENFDAAVNHVNFLKGFPPHDHVLFIGLV